ncbi:unnamed protein product [Notodromas monacha]|uniref:Ion transport domain-containing protein n=1 Tax=Notodromas monacha TaxID=399045 RepID=A0A7R9GDE2_9CRUS|nr:unnamed protein product [Notodromas monacha]CAG0916835.1 unnamed protein product [Notodromas monacha]
MGKDQEDNRRSSEPYDIKRVVRLAVHSRDSESVAIIVKKATLLPVYLDDLKKSNANGKTPLMLAIADQDADIVDLFLEHLRAVSPFKIAEQCLEGPVETAAAVGNEEIFKKLLNFAKSSLDPEVYNRAMVQAAVNGQTACLEMLLTTEKVDLNFGDAEGVQQTALHKCILRSQKGEAYKNYVECARMLLKFGADPNVLDKFQATPIHYSAIRGCPEITQLLLDYKAIPEVFNSLGNSPLHAAAESGQADCLKLLLNHPKARKLSIAQNLQGKTYFHIACENADASTIRTIINLDPELDTVIPDRSGYTALHYAVLRGETDIVKIFIERGLFKKNEEGLRTTNNGDTLLHLAAEANDDPELIELLVSYGEPVNHGNDQGSTPIHMAIKAGHEDNVMMLHSKFAKLTIPDELGDTPLRLMLQKMPHVLKKIMDRMVTVTGKDFSSKNLQVKVNFEDFAIPKTTAEGLSRVQKSVSVDDEASEEYSAIFRCFNFVRNKMKYSRESKPPSDTETFMEFVSCGRQHLLAHPVCRVFTDLKWNRYRRIWFTYFLLNVIFVLSLSTHQCIFFGYLGYDSIGNPKIWECSIKKIPTVAKVALHRLDYFKQPENIFQLVTFVLVLLTSPYPNAPPKFRRYQHHLSAACVLIAWTQMMVFVGKTPRMGIYIAMFKQMAQVFIQFVLIYIWIIVGCALALFILFVESGEQNGYNPFDNPLKSLMKAVIMLTGEFDYVSTFESDVPYPVTTHVVYLFFVLLVTLILGNLLVSLAVNELKNIQRQAEIKRMVRMLELIAYVEYILPYESILYMPTLEANPFFSPNDRLNRDKLIVEMPHRGGIISSGLWYLQSFHQVKTEGSVKDLTGVAAPKVSNATLQRHGWITLDKDIFAGAMKIVERRHEQESFRSKYFGPKNVAPEIFQQAQDDESSRKPGRRWGLGRAMIKWSSRLKKDASSKNASAQNPDKEKLPRLETDGRRERPATFATQLSVTELQSQVKVVEEKLDFLLERVENMTRMVSFGYVSTEDGSGNTPLHIATKKGMIKILDVLLPAYLDDLTKSNIDGKTPLMLAIANQSMEIVDFFLNYVGEHFPSQFATLCLAGSVETAAFVGNEEILKTLLNFAKSSLDSDVYNKAMVQAAVNGQDVCLEMILTAEKVDLNFGRAEGKCTALHECILNAEQGERNRHYVECVRKLLESGADPNVSDVYGSTPIHYAALRGLTEITGILLDYKAKLKVSNSLWNSPLHAAAESCQTDCLQLLLKHPDVCQLSTVQNRLGKTYLHLACENADVSMIRAILDVDPELDSEIADTSGFTALHYAVMRGETDIVKLFIERGLLKENEEGWRTTNNGDTLLHLAAEANDDPELIELLVNKGEPVNVRNAEGSTPIHIAVKAGYEDNVLMLHSKSAKLTVPDDMGDTPLRLMLQRMPHVLKKIMDGMVTVLGTDFSNKHLQVQINFEDFALPRTASQHSGHTNKFVSEDNEFNEEPSVFLRCFNFVRKKMKYGRDSKPPSDTDTFMEFVSSGRRNLLTHPVCRVFTDLKWNRYRKIWFAYFLLNLAFVSSLSVYQCIFFGYLGYDSIGHSEFWQCSIKSNITNDESPFQSSWKLPVEEVANQWRQEWKDAICGLYFFSFSAMYVTLAMLTWLETYQVALHGLIYFRQPENISQLTTFILVLLTTPYPSAPREFRRFQHHLSAACVLIASTQMMVFVGKTPSMGIYISMFKQMAQSGEQHVYNPFDNPLKSIMKSIVMLTGEFDFVGTFEGNIPYPVTTHVVYLFFVLLVTLILGNLLVSLAVNELKNIQRQAEIRRMVHLMRLIAYVEYILPYEWFLYMPTREAKPGFFPNDRMNRDKLVVKMPRLREMIFDGHDWIKLDKDIFSGAMKIIERRRENVSFSSKLGPKYSSPENSQGTLVESSRKPGRKWKLGKALIEWSSRLKNDVSSKNVSSQNNDEDTHKTKLETDGPRRRPAEFYTQVSNAELQSQVKVLEEKMDFMLERMGHMMRMSVRSRRYRSDSLSSVE